MSIIKLAARMSEKKLNMYKKLAQILGLTVGITYGGHLLVKHLSPNEDELFAVNRHTDKILLILIEIS